METNHAQPSNSDQPENERPIQAQNEQAASAANDATRSEDNPAAAHASWEAYEQDPGKPHLTAADDAEKETGRPTDAIYGHDGAIMYVSDEFQDEDDAAGAAPEDQPEGNPS